MIHLLKKYSWMLISFCILFAQSASAWYIVGSSSQTIDPNRRTHIFFTSRGNDLNANPVLAALSSQSRVQQNNSRDQFVFLITVKDEAEANRFISLGIPNAKLVKEMLVHTNANSFFLQFSKIASMHYFGHGGVSAGMFLDKFDMNGLDLDVRYNYDLLPSELKSHFTSDAYVHLNACNQGQLLAPKMSEIFGIPVAAAHTGTHFEVVHKDGNFYWAEDGGIFNSKEFWHPQWRESAQAMFRMKPNYFTSTHRETGEATVVFNRGLPFYKVFCAKQDTSECKKRMAKILIDSPTLPRVDINSSLETFKQAAREWLCPSYRWKVKSQFDCMDYLKQKFDQENPSQDVKTYNPFSGNLSVCNSKSCFPEPQESACLIDPWMAWECLKMPPAKDRKPSTALYDEYSALVDGFKLLQKK